jgi:putative mRNA 3-end processing factor
MSSGKNPLLRATSQGLYCEAGNFYIDPWRPVHRAIVTHAHSDHVCYGCGRYLASKDGEQVLRPRLGMGANIQTLAYGESLAINGVNVSLHPAGHILGAAQVRVEANGEIWVVSGDYKVHPDPTCTPFEVVRCHTFVTESTFGLPIYRWPSPADIFDSINAWWRANQSAGKATVLFGYSLGKAQRLITGVDSQVGPVYTHESVEAFNIAYRRSGVTFPETIPVPGAKSGEDWTKALIVAPPSANNSEWLHRFGTVSTGYASGWMIVRGTRRRQTIDRGFVLSDHADWPGLIETINATGAEHIWVTHGFSEAVVRWLTEQGLDAHVLPARYEKTVPTSTEEKDQTE